MLRPYIQRPAKGAHIVSNAPGQGETAELAMQAITLARLAGSVAHEVKNPLNAMALQVALLMDKLAVADGVLASSCAAHLSSLRNQIGRINDVVRRYVDIADPTATPGGFDAGALLADVTHLFGHELRRRRIALNAESTAGVVRAAGDGVRPTRLLLGLLWRAITGTPPGGRLAVHAAPANGFAELSITHSIGEADPSLEWVETVVAAAARELGGSLERTSRDGLSHYALRLPKENEP